MNVIYIYADDLGRGMLSCYGQKYFQTPNIDRLADEGRRFTNAYGCCVCAPARASLLTGYHDCHAGTWSYSKAGIYKELSTGGRSYDEIRELINNTSFNERSDEVFLAEARMGICHDAGAPGEAWLGLSLRLLRSCQVPRILPAVPVGERENDED